MKEYIIGVPDDEPLSSLRRSGKTITAIAKITGNCDEVIRCKDCKHNKNSEWVDCPITEFFGRTLDNYCSLAEREENETSG